MEALPDEPEGVLQVTDEGSVPAPAWYEDYEGYVEIVTPALSVVIESRGASPSDPRKLAGESAPFPLAPDPWHRYGEIAGKGLDSETAAKAERTHPDKLLFDLGEEYRLYRIDGLQSLPARNDCR